ncbi:MULTISPECIES: HD domain-containing phosphohydrolase [Paraburkholderia]|uniref:HD domain-containing phosphohydrolase n=1 Tax=Paraburkholderia TaxID=1822464 RepID=UPI002252C1E4|nr:MULTISPECIES: HD domain-containing phosphohydrolase [Paraburkholderia]MCX4161881.1 LuxR C-terminal-related transcriptional regulator [Paraburkholderia megapolitana]MDN7157378.1 LuxR C-terminal-related transcriptional regulator [Paraburkholderia sp. CHISQ3]MDQ6494423.1 LuxR C-terminal-related transcriptional regulator [Paraburkholderia megapolitana]
MPAGGLDIRTFDAVKALAFIGDLSMGQPTDHSLRTAWLAAQIAGAASFRADICDTVREASLLRWSGCTANAAEFTNTFGDDVEGRAAMLAERPDWAELLNAQGGPAQAIAPLAQIHCEVSGEVARILGLGSETEATLRHIFETWDGNGMPNQLNGKAVPAAVFVVALAGDLEIFSRVYGLEHALVLIAHRANFRYPATLTIPVNTHAAQWLDTLAQLAPAALDAALLTPQMQHSTSPDLIADVLDLKLPWMTGYSRAVATTAAACCTRLVADPEASERVYRAGLIHGIGRAAVPNAIWDTPARLSAAQWEKVRLVPYWTSRAGKQMGTLDQATELASYAYERLDGSGYFRAVGGPALGLEARILAASAAWVALRSKRPWRDALSDAAASELLRAEAEQGRFDSDVVEALLEGEPTAAHSASPRSTRYAAETTRLSSREIDVLNLISHGASNKEAARALNLSPSTVRTHVERVFRKLECTTRAAATLKASAMGLLR